MAERLASFPFKRGGRRSTVYPWADWEEGIWKVTYGEDFKIHIKSFTSLLHGHARKTPGLKVRTGVTGHSVVFEFFSEEKK